MGVSTEITLIFKCERHARWASHVVEGIIKIALAAGTMLEEDLGLSRYDSLTSALSACEDELKAFDPVADDPHCALAWMRRSGTRVVIQRCSDIQRSFSLTEDALDDEPFPQICLACALRFPQVPFAAYCRHEQTTSGFVELTRAAWDGSRLRFRRHSGELPFDEMAWDTWDMLDLRFCDGAYVTCDEAASPLKRHYLELLDEMREAAAAGDVAGALYFADAAEALPGCADLPQIAIERGLAAEHLRRCGVRRVRELWTSQVPEGLRDELAASESVTEMPLGGGRFVLQAKDAGFVIVDTGDGSVVGEGGHYFNSEPTRVAHDFLVYSGGRYFLIDWEYVVEPPLANMW